MSERRDAVTQILQRVGENEEAWESLLPLVYEELRALARSRMARERAQHTLEATALVHEAYLRLIGDRDMKWRDRRHFFGAAAESMRRILVDHARRVRSQKRGGDRQQVTMTLGGVEDRHDPEQFLALDEALQKLEGEDSRAAEVARLRFFAGLGVEETAAVLDVSARTVMREWTYARTRLAEILKDAE